MTLGFNALGRMGRLCNQMFQYAAVKGISKNIGTDFCIPNHQHAVDDGIGNMQRTELFDLFDLECNIGFLNNGHAPVVQERFFHFDEELFKLCPDHVDLRGYFQSEKYFKHIEKEIRRDFTFKDEILTPCKEMIEGVEKPIALHVRRTDYVKNSDNHPVCTIEYYKAALDHFDSDRNVIVFSDDPLWCHDEGTFADDRFLISENDHLLDLAMMRLCSDFIIANSSFSWWGAWMSTNENKKVIAPKNWFGPPLDGQNDTKDLYCPKWILI